MLNAQRYRLVQCRCVIRIAQLFRRADQPLATSAFVEYGDDVYLLGEFGNYLRIPEGRGTAAQR